VFLHFFARFHNRSAYISCGDNTISIVTITHAAVQHLIDRYVVIISIDSKHLAYV